MENLEFRIAKEKEKIAKLQLDSVCQIVFEYSEGNLKPKTSSTTTSYAIFTDTS